MNADASRRTRQIPSSHFYEGRSLEMPDLAARLGASAFIGVHLWFQTSSERKIV
jgi:hypothetical protein